MASSRSSGIPFGRYRLRRRIARGGMAEVFLGRLIGAEGFERPVAIKRILPHLADSKEFIAMFLDEAKMASELAHPNVVHIYEFGQAGDDYFIAMEFVDGIDLGRVIREAEERPLRPEHAARIAADVCAGLHYAHGRGLVHRDVSPQNVLVSWDGVVKLVDFGIAKAAWQAERTRPGMVKGKWAFMSPEQIEGRKLDGRSDLFSLGTVLHELLTGRPRFRRDEAELAMAEILEGKPLELAATVPEELRLIVLRATLVDREARFATAGEMQIALERFLGHTGRLTTGHLLGEHLKETYPREDPVDGDDAGEATGAAVAISSEENPAHEIAASPIATAVIASRAIDPTSMTPLPSRESRRGSIGILAGVAVALAAAVFSWIGYRNWIAKTPLPISLPNAPAATAIVVDAGRPSVALVDVVTQPPGATVSADGQRLEGATPAKALVLTPGHHHLEVWRAGFVTHALDLDLAPGEHRTIELELRAIRTPLPPLPSSPGTLTVQTVPWSEVFEGKRLIGTTPLALVSLPAGSHTLTFKNPQLPPLRRTITVQPNRELRLHIALDGRSR